MSKGKFQNIIKTGRAAVRKTGIIFLIAVFTAVSIFPVSRAFSEVSDVTGLSEVSSLDSGYSCLDVETFTIPPHLGEVRFSHKGNTDRIVIHLQDAHCNYFAQTKIADIISYLNKEYGVNVLNLEGGAGDYDLSVFTNISGQEIRREVAEYFVKKGEVNGAEFYAINNPEDVLLWGIEDKDLYLKNLKVYRDSLVYKAEVDAYLKELRRIFNNLKKSIYPAELLKIDMAYNAYKSGNMDFKSYLDFLIVTAKSKGYSIKKYPNLYLISQAMEKETGVDFKRANAERSVLVDKIKGTLSRNEMGELISKTVEFKTKRISVKDFYNYLLGKARECGLKTSDYPALTSYIIYVSLFEAVDPFLVMEELDKLEAALKEPLYLKDNERELNGLSRNLALLGNIFELMLTKNDYAYYKDNKDSFLAGKFLSFIEKQAPLYGVSARLPEEILRMDSYLESITGFYELSFERDEAFIKNMRFSAVSKGSEAALIMTGGFHTENLAELFRKEGYSYVSIMPKFTSEEDYDSPYFTILAGQTADVQQMLRSALAETALLQVVSLLNADPSLADVFYEGNAGGTFKAAVAILAFLREQKGYDLGGIAIETISRGNEGLTVRVNGEDVIVPWKNVGMIDGSDISMLNEIVDAAKFNTSSEGAFTEKYFIHNCMKKLEEGKTLVVMTGETSGLSDLNSEWGHMGVDAARDAFGEEMYKLLNSDDGSMKDELAGYGVELVGHNNPYGGRWHFAFQINDLAKYRGYLSGEDFGVFMAKVYGKAKGNMKNNDKLAGLSKILSEMSSFNVVFGVSEPRDIRSIMDKEGSSHEDLKKAYETYKDVPQTDLDSDSLSKIGDVYKYGVMVLYGDSLRGIIYAENAYYGQKAPMLLSRELREKDAGKERTTKNIFNSEIPANIKRIFFSGEKISENETIQNWYQNNWKKRWGIYDVFRFRIPDFALVEKAVKNIGTGPISQRQATLIISENLKLHEPAVTDFSQFLDYSMSLAVLSHDDMPQGRKVINTLVRKYAEKNSGVMFRINLDFDDLSKASPDRGDIVNSRGVKLIEKFFSESLGTAVTVRSGSGDEMVVVGYFPGSQASLEEIIRGVLAKINGPIGLEGLKDSSGRDIKWKDEAWVPSVSAGACILDLSDKRDIETNLTLMDAKSEKAIEAVKRSGKRNVKFFSELPPEDKGQVNALEKEDITMTIPSNMADGLFSAISGVFESRGLKDPFSFEFSASAPRAPPKISAGIADEGIQRIIDLYVGKNIQDNRLGDEQKNEIIDNLVDLLGISEREIAERIIDDFNDVLKDVIRSKLTKKRVEILRNKSGELTGTQGMTMEAYQFSDPELGEIVIKFPREGVLRDGTTQHYEQVFSFGRTNKEGGEKEVEHSIEFYKQKFMSEVEAKGKKLPEGEAEAMAKEMLSEIARGNIADAYDFIRLKLGNLFAPLIVQDLVLMIETVDDAGNVSWQERRMPYAIVQQRVTPLTELLSPMNSRIRELKEEIWGLKQDIENLGRLQKLTQKGKEKAAEIEKNVAKLEREKLEVEKERDLLTEKFRELVANMGKMGIVDRDMTNFRNNYGVTRDGKIVGFDADYYAIGGLNEKNEVEWEDVKFSVLMGAKDREDLTEEQRKFLSGKLDKFNEEHKDVWASLPPVFEGLIRARLKGLLDSLSGAGETVDAIKSGNVDLSEIKGFVQDVAGDGYKEPVSAGGVAVYDGSELSGNIAEGLDNTVKDKDGKTEEDRWREESSIPENQVASGTVTAVKNAAKTIIDEKVPEIRASLKEKNVPDQEIEKVERILNNLAQSLPRKDMNGGEIIGWMRSRAEITPDGKEKYLLGNQSALSEDIVEFLILSQGRTDLSPQEKAYLLEEYILHEVLENTSLEHGEIIGLTTKLFGRGEMGVDFNRHGETPLGAALRSFLDVKLVTSAATGVLQNMRPGEHPNVTLIPVKGDQLLWDGSTLNSLKNNIGRVVSRKYGLDSYIFYYDVDSPDLSNEISEIMKRVTGIKSFSDDKARLVAYADSSQTDIIRSVIADTLETDKLTGIVSGEFKNVAAEERTPVVTLEVLGLGLMEWDRAGAAGEDSRQKNITDSLLELFVRISGNTQEIKEFIANNCAGDPGKFIKSLISGGFIMVIKKMDFKEIRQFMESEAAILRSL